MKASLHERAILTLYTGYCFVQGDEMDEVYKIAKELIGRPVYSHELHNETTVKELQCRVKPQFVKIMENLESE